MLTKAQLTEAYKNPYNLKRIKDWVNKYYTKPYFLIIEFDNVNNDEGYNTSVRYVAVYNAKGKEILPNPKTAKESRNRWDSLPHLDYDELARDILGEDGYDETEIIEEIKITL
jgi:hypothetical protein